ncbi:hypothetical protein KI387_020365, partial [Taxus chinensis]
RGTDSFNMDFRLQIIRGQGVGSPRSVYGFTGTNLKRRPRGPRSATMVTGTFKGSLKAAPHHKEEDEELWNTFNKRGRTSLSDSSSYENDGKKKKKKKKEEEDMKVLKEGLQVVASSLTQLTHTLEPSAVDVDGNGINLGETPFSLSLQDVIPQQIPDSNSKESVEDAAQVQGEGGGKLRHHRNVAEAMAAKAKFVERQMKSLKADLCFVRERCAFLEEENARLRERDGDGVRPEEDDLVRLQLEALLAEKGRLAQENANYARENEYLHQLVEYHQLTLTLHEDMTAMPPAMSLDFSPPPLPPMKRNTENEEHHEPHFDYEHDIAA